MIGGAVDIAADGPTDERVAPPARCRRPGHGPTCGALWPGIDLGIEMGLPSHLPCLASMSEERTAACLPPSDWSYRWAPGWPLDPLALLSSKLVDVRASLSPRRPTQSNAQNVSA